MFNVLSAFQSRRRTQSGTFNSSTAPSITIALADGRSVIPYWFNDERLLFHAERDWRFMGSLPRNTTRAAIVSVAEAYFRGFDQARGELRELGLSDEFFEMARRYELANAEWPRT
ncbi:MAG: hypothetical protein HYX38_29010 [Rhodospirillales bacterium]|nr:hypothetical protein [Rhodospirillales bacterium]